MEPRVGMDLEELLKIVGGHYMALYLEKEVLRKRFERLQAEMAELKKKYEPEVPTEEVENEG